MRFEVFFFFIIIIRWEREGFFFFFFFLLLFFLPSLVAICLGGCWNEWGREFWEIMGRYRSGVINMMQRLVSLSTCFMRGRISIVRISNCKYVLINGELPWKM